MELLGKSKDGTHVKVRECFHTEKWALVDLLQQEDLISQEQLDNWQEDEVIERLMYFGYEIEAHFWIDLTTGESSLDWAGC